MFLYKPRLLSVTLPVEPICPHRPALGSPTRNRKSPAMTISDDKEHRMNRCDWTDCLAMGVFAGIHKSLLNAEGRKNTSADETRFIYLCPEHFDLGMGNKPNHFST